MRGERRARTALILLCLIAPLVYVPRALLGHETDLPAQVPPAWTHLVIVSAGAWPDVAQSLDDPTLAAFDRRASRVSAAFSTSPSRAAAAASLWTGRYPRGHGVLDASLALAPGRWTLARAARSVGTRTAAFLNEPLVSAHGLGGFDEASESANAGGEELGDLAARFLADIGDDRALIWIHVADAGPQGAEVAAALARVEAALEETDRAPESAVVVAAMARAPLGEAGAGGAIDRLGAPLWVALPGALAVGRRSTARLSHVDLTAVLARLLGLGPPADAALDGRAELAWNALRGGGGDPGVVVQRATLDVWRRGDVRVLLDAANGAARAEARTAGAWTPLASPAAAEPLAAAQTAAAAAQPNPTPAVPARAPAGAWPAGR